MLTVLLVLCAVATDAAPLAAKPATVAESELSTASSARIAVIVSPPRLTEGEKASTASATPAARLAVIVSPLEVKLIKQKKFHALEKVLKASKKLLPIPEKPAETTEQTATTTAATSIATTEVTTAPLVVKEESSEPPERDVEILKAHIDRPLVATPMFEDEKAARFRHSALFGFPSFF